jgi:lipid-A-disaccharide synthase
LSPGLLVVAGEPSGDALAADVIAHLDTASFGLGGPRLSRAGTDVMVHLGPIAAMGLTAVVARAPRLAHALLTVRRAVERRRPRAALLVGFSEMNARLAPFLRERGVAVLWYAPPQVWAWRPHRARPIAAYCDRMAVTLPFETACWQRAGAAVEYVGHAAASRPFTPEGTDAASRVVLLPGSRAHEVRAHLLPFLGAARHLSRFGYATELVLAEGLEASTAAWAAERACRSGVDVARGGLDDALSRATTAIVASGTATLECAAAGVPPVIVYRTDPVTFAFASRLVRVAHVALPNLVLERRAFPELLQRAVTADRIAAAVHDVVRARKAHRESCREVRTALSASLDARRPGERVAATLRSWL